MSPLYIPARGGYRVLFMGSTVADLYRGEASWWLLTDHKCFRLDTLRDAEAMVAKACARLEMGDPR